VALSARRKDKDNVRSIRAPETAKVGLAQLSEGLRGSCVAQAVEVRRKGDDGSYRG
jgi:hypothetical protein